MFSKCSFNFFEQCMLSTVLYLEASTSLLLIVVSVSHLKVVFLLSLFRGSA